MDGGRIIIDVFEVNFVSLVIRALLSTIIVAPLLMTKKPLILSDAEIMYRQ